MKNKNAFTLAEVLITLAIIGIVAAMTIPTLISKYQEKATVTKVKKFYSMISQAVQLATIENGQPNTWPVSDSINAQSATELANIIKPYLKISKDCGTEAGCLNYNENVFRLDNRQHSVNHDTNTNYYKMVLIDGSSIHVRASQPYCEQFDSGIENTCGIVTIDINGGKSPNTFGKDIFNIYITPNGVKTVSSDSCTGDGTSPYSAGWGCLEYIMHNNNMNYLKD